MAGLTKSTDLPLGSLLRKGRKAQTLTLERFETLALFLLGL